MKTLNSTKILYVVLAIAVPLIVWASYFVASHAHRTTV